MSSANGNLLEVNDLRTYFDTEDGVVVFTGDTGKTWLELTGSVSAQVSRNATLYGDLGQTWDVNGDGRAWTVRLGARFNW